MEHFFQIYFDQPSCFAWFWVYNSYISGPSHVYVHLLVQMDSNKKAYG